MSLGEIQELLHDAGLRAEITTDLQGNPIIGSAAGGLMFDVRPGGIANASPKDGLTSYIDFAFVVTMRVARPMPLEMVNDWNARHRFGRVSQEPGFVCLDFDILVAPGVSRGFLRTAIELWASLVGDFQQYLHAAFPPA